jgi:hypothetical protein
MLADILRSSFSQAGKRSSLVLLDILWKTIWFVSSFAAVILVAAWFGSELRDLAWEDTGAHATNALIAIAAMREFWRELKGEVLLAAVLIALISATLWFLLEAFVHREFVGAGFSRSRAAERQLTDTGAFGARDRLKPAPTVFFLSRVTKAAVLTTAGLILLVVWLKGAPGLAVILFLLLAFCLTVVETLIRADAVELLGTDLIRVTGLIGILMSIETMVAALLVVILTGGFLHVARLGDALAMLGLTGIAVVFLSVLHSYLLLVRFSAVGIMSGCECQPDRAQPSIS